MVRIVKVLVCAIMTCKIEPGDDISSSDVKPLVDVLSFAASALSNFTAVGNSTVSGFPSNITLPSTTLSSTYTFLATLEAPSATTYESEGAIFTPDAVVAVSSESSTAVETSSRLFSTTVPVNAPAERTSVFPVNTATTSVVTTTSPAATAISRGATTSNAPAGTPGLDTSARQHRTDSVALNNGTLADQITDGTGTREATLTHGALVSDTSKGQLLARKELFSGPIINSSVPFNHSSPTKQAAYPGNSSVLANSSHLEQAGSWKASQPVNGSSAIAGLNSTALAQWHSLAETKTNPSAATLVASPNGLNSSEFSPRLNNSSSTENQTSPAGLNSDEVFPKLNASNLVGNWSGLMGLTRVPMVGAASHANLNGAPDSWRYSNSSKYSITQYLKQHNDTDQSSMFKLSPNGTVVFDEELQEAIMNEIMHVAMNVDWVEFFDMLDETAVDEPEIPDKEYFEMTQENIDRSRVGVWYSGWTVARQNSSEWAKRGEWNLFFSEFMDDNNFHYEAGLKTPTVQLPRPQDIMALTAHNYTRPQARRIFFVTQIYHYMHEYSGIVDDRFTHVQGAISGLMPELVKASSHQVDESRKFACTVLTEMVTQLITSTITAVTAIVTDGLLAPLVAEISVKLERELVDVEDAVFKMIDRELKTLPHNKGGPHGRGGLDPFTVCQGRILCKKGDLDHIPHIKEFQIPLKRYNGVNVPAKVHKYKMDHTRQRHLRDRISILKTQGKFVIGDRVHVDKHTTLQMREAMRNSLKMQASGLGIAVANKLESSFGPKLISGDRPAFPWGAAAANNAFREWPKNYLQELVSSPNGDNPLGVINSEMSHDLLCAGFEGSGTDLNAGNTQILQNRLGTEVQRGRNQALKIFSAIYEGVIPEPGKPSMMARWMLARKWVGRFTPGTVQYDMAHIPIFDKQLELNIVKELFSMSMIQGHNYMKCGHVKNAQELCHKTGQSGKWYSEEERTVKKGFFDAIICPRSETDPTLMCQAGKWYNSQFWPHEIESDFVKSLDKFGKDHNYKFDTKEWLQEAYEYWVKYGNDATDIKWGVWSFDAASSRNPSFHLPVCMDGNATSTFQDVSYSGNKASWQFPVMCGNSLGNETADFMKAAQFGPGSSTYRERQDNTANLLYIDRIPRLIWNLPPYNNYMIMGEAGIRWPNHGEDGAWLHRKFRIKAQLDQEFEMVKNATLGLTEDEANHWFCTNAGKHTIFSRERTFVDMPTGDVARWFNHWHQCKDWLKNNSPRVVNEHLQPRLGTDQEMSVLLEYMEADKAGEGGGGEDFEGDDGDNDESKTGVGTSEGSEDLNA